MWVQRISVIVPVYNSIQHLKICLDSILVAIERHGNAELILLDNGSTDGSYELLLSEYSQKARVFRCADVTVAALRNEGLRVASGEYLSFIDSDMLVPDHYLETAASLFDTVDTDALVSTFALPPSPDWVGETWTRLHWNTPEGYVPLYSGTFIIKRHAFESVGGFNPTLITDEDMELGARLNSAGCKIYKSPRFACVHTGEPRTLGEFFRRQSWHGLGMLANPEKSRMNKPLIMTLCHFGLTILGAAGLVLLPVAPGYRLLAFLRLSLVVPAITVTYRFWGMRAVYRPWRSLVLYYVYYSARITSLFRFMAAHFHTNRPAKYSPRSHS